METNNTEKTASEVYASKLFTYVASGVGVILTRSREPFRTVEALQDMARSHKKHMQTWDCLKGWNVFDPHKPTQEEKVDSKTKEFGAALAAIVDPKHYPSQEDGGYFAMVAPDFWLSGKIPPVNQYIREYSSKFSKSKHRLVLIAGAEYSLPDELKDEVAVVDFDIPTTKDLGSSYSSVIEVGNEMAEVSKGPQFTDDELKRLRSAGQGITVQEFESALSQTIIKNREQYPNIPFDTFLADLMKAKTEVVRRSEILEIMPSEDISQIGGMSLLKKWITQRANCFSQEAKDFGIEAPKGCALIGAPGLGKSLSFKVIANMLGVPLIRFDIGKVFNKYVGESEGRVRGALKMLEAMAPVVVLVDEVDKAGLGTNGGDSGVGTRILGSILTFMQENPAPIFWGFSANRIEGVPSELLRKGRLDEVFSVTMPNDQERKEILSIHLSKRGHDPEEIEDLDIAVESSSEYVSAEIEAAVKDALIVAFNEGKELTGNLISDQFKDMVPLSKAFADDFNKMNEWATNNAKPVSEILDKVKSRKRTRKLG
jgi:SpoVK/Ycf46/Vps4 family AAA+-type ATPase